MNISPEVEIAFALAAKEATRRRHEFITVEHLLYALLLDDDTARILKASGANVPKLKKRLEKFLEEELEELPEDSDAQPGPSLGFHRVLQRAALHVQSSG